VTDVTPDASTLELYDFGRPASLSRENARALNSAFDAFARQWAVQLTSKTRTRVHVAVSEVTMETYDEYIESVPSHTAMIVCGPQGEDDRGILEFPLDVAILWIAKMIGGADNIPVPDRALTILEQALLRQLVDESIGMLRSALNGLLPDKFRSDTVQYNPSFAQIAGATDPVVVARFEMKIGDRDNVPATFAIPAAGFLERLSRADELNYIVDPDALRQHVETIDVELSLRVRPQTIDPDQVLNLAVGDIISLNHAVNRPLDLAIGDHIIGTATQGASGSRLACAVTATYLSDTLTEELS